MEQSRTKYLAELRARIMRSQYEVDPDAVAEAIVQRLVTQRRRRLRSRRPPGGPQRRRDAGLP